MSLVLLAAFLATPHAPSLIGAWERERSAEVDRMDVAQRPTMTITPGAILFEQGRQITSLQHVQSIDVGTKGGHDGKGREVSVVTREGTTYRFRFADADHICRLPDRPARMPMLGEHEPCWQRIGAEAPSRDEDL